MRGSFAPSVSPKQRLLNRVHNADIGETFDIGGVRITKIGYDEIALIGRHVKLETLPQLVGDDGLIRP